MKSQACALALLALAFAAPAFAADEESPAGEDKVATASALSESIGAEDVRKLFEAVRADANLDPAVRQTVTQLLNQAGAELRRLAEYTAKATEFDHAAQQAPAMQEAIRGELAEAPATPSLDIPADATLAQLEQSLAQAEADLAAAQKKVQELEAEAKGRTDRRAELPKQIAEANERLKELKEQLEHVSETTDEGPQLGQARRCDLLARRFAIESELRAHEKEMLSYDARRELLAARRDRAARRQTDAENMAKAWRTEVAERRRRESELAAEEARKARQAAARLHPGISAIADRNAELAELRAGENGLTRRIEKAGKDLQTARDAIVAVKERTAQIEQRIDAAGLTDAVALLLRREKRDLPDVRQYGARTRQRKREITQVQLHLIDLDDRRSALFDTASRVDEVADEVMDEDWSREDVVPILTELLTAQRGLLDALLAEHNTYFNTLVDLDAAEHLLVTEVNALASLIAEHILWVRSDPAFGLSSVVHIGEGLEWVLAAERWREVVHTLWNDARRRPFLPLLLVVVEVLVVLCCRRSARRLKVLAPLVATVRTDRFAYTFETLAHTVLRSLSGVAALAYLAWRLYGADSVSVFTKAVGDAFGVLAAAVFVVGLLCEMCASNGLAEKHFHWRRELLSRIRPVLLRASAALLPSLWLGTLCRWYDEKEALLDLGRFCWIVFLVTLCVVAYLLLRPRGAVQTALTERQPSQWLVRFRRPVFVLCFSVPLALAVASLAGYHYTTMELTRWLAQSAALVYGILFVQALLLRGIQVIARRDELECRERARCESERHDDASGGEDATGADREPETVSSVADISAQTRKLIRAGIAFLLLVGLWLIWADVLPALGILDTIALWTSEGKTLTTGPDGASTVAVAFMAITLADLLLACVVAVMTATSARYLPGVLELAVLRHLPLAHGERYALTTIVRYVITAVGVVVVFNIMGIGWPKVQWLIAALSVGLGFGLQEIFANFVSGLILLFERPIRVGDYVTVGDTSGEVTRIQIRATTITNWDRKELIIPNRQFVTGELVNWTLSDAIIRVIVPVGVAYGSDTRKVKETLLRVADGNPAVVKDPEPTAFFVEFGDSSLNFELRAFIRSAEHFMAIKDELHTAVDQAFREADIEIAFPQRDLHVRSVQTPIPVGSAGETTPPQAEG